jgi:hypothetical protein
MSQTGSHNIAEELLSNDWLIDWLIDWCLMPTLTVFQLYCGVNKFYVFDTHKTLKNKTYMSIKQSGLYVEIKETLKG